MSNGDTDTVRTVLASKAQPTLHGSATPDYRVNCNKIGRTDAHGHKHSSTNLSIVRFPVQTKQLLGY